MFSEQQAFRLFSVQGIPVRMHPAILAILGGLLLAEALLPGTGRGLRFALGLVVLLVSVTAHELGHALVARRIGLHVEDIIFHMLFAVCRTGRPRTPRAEVLVALGGPAANLLLAGLFWPLHALAGDTSEVASFALRDALIFNIVLGGVNLLPVFPMDGGRVLRAALQTRLGLVRATEAAAWSGRVLCVLTVAVPVIFGVSPATLIIPLGGLVVMSLGELERRRVRALGDA